MIYCQKRLELQKKICSYEICNFEDEVWFRTADGSHHKLEATDRGFIVPMIDRIKEFYPEAYAKLSEKYNKCAFNLLHFQYN